MAKTMDPLLHVLSILGSWAILLGAFGGPGKPPNVPLLRALWSLLDGIWGLLKGSWGVLVVHQIGIRQGDGICPPMVWSIWSLR